MRCQLVAAVVAGVILSTVAVPSMLAAETVRATAAHDSYVVSATERAERMGVTVIVTDTPCGHPKTEWGGCFDPTMSNEVQVAQYGGVYDSYTILHELSHVRQFREGLPMTECGADLNAARWGALVSGYDCPGLVSQEDFER